MYIRRILLIVVLAGLVGCGIFAYGVYNAIFSPNTVFNEEEAIVFIPTEARFGEVKEILAPWLKSVSSFEEVARRKGYAANPKGGKYRIKKGMNNNEIINSLRSGNIPVRVSFNNQENLEKLAGRIAQQLEADSLSLLKAFADSEFLKAHGFNTETSLGLYLPNSYEFFWNTSAEGFRDRMFKEYRRFWNKERVSQAEGQGLSRQEVITLASIVHKETAKDDERPRVAGVYLNRLRKKMALQADPTVIFALKKHLGNQDTLIKRVLYRDLELDSPYNTYKYTGLPPGPITMPDITAIDAVLQPEEHRYYYFVANVEDFGYHMFAETLAQHNRNKAQYIRWLNSRKIKR
ncbi:MAG: endolytic transglycosylase MltG [Bacteroidota bacterium]